jgi:hypothetical protein
MPRLSWAVLSILFAVLLCAGGVRAQGGANAAPPVAKNLQVLTPDVNIAKVMAVFASGLGVQCAYCHLAGDFASDANPKRKWHARCFD